MNHQPDSKRETEFLQEQVREAERKIARQQEALDACSSDLELEGLQRLLQNAQAERDLLQDLLKQQSSSEAVSLEAMIMQQVNQLHQRASRLAEHWQRGQPTPPAYWESESQRGFLLDTLRRYHAWQADETPPAAAAPEPAANGTNGASRTAQNGAHPWFDADENPPSNGGSATWTLDELQDQIDKALASAGYPAHHLEIIVQPQGLVVVTGHAHSAEDREQALTAIMSVEDVWEIVSDIKIIAEEHCPICHPPAPPMNGTADY